MSYGGNRHKANESKIWWRKGKEDKVEKGYLMGLVR